MRIIGGSMGIDMTVIALIAGPVIGGVVGSWATRKFENRPVLNSYYMHVSAFRYQPPTGNVMQIHTHSVVLYNAGRRSATNVRLHHNYLPDFNIWPIVRYQVETLPDGTKDIVVPTLVPGEQIIISYLYFPPITYTGINAGIKHDDGFAHPINVLIQRQYPVWLRNVLEALVFIGVVAVVYLLYLFASWLFKSLVST